MQQSLFLLLLLVFSTNLFAQDSLKISLRQADSLLLINNLSLITAQYNVDINKAQQIQAKLFTNPDFYAEFDLFNKNKQRFFDVGNEGEKIFTLAKTFKIAGQRNQLIKITTQQIKISELEYFELVRTLKFQLRESFFSLYFLRKTANAMQDELSLLAETLTAYSKEYARGNVSLKDYTRLQATYFQLLNNRTELMRTSFVHANTLKTLLGIEQSVVSVPTEKELNKYNANLLTIKTLQDTAFANRPDLQVATEQINLDKMNVSLQKKMAVPDLRLGVTYDQNGSYVPDYTGVFLNTTLPFFNRNQGLIKMAEIQTKQSENNMKLTQLQIKNEITAAYNQLLQIENEYQKVTGNFEDQLENMSKGLIENYKKRNLSLLEFTDLFETYNHTIMELNNLRMKRIVNFEEINYLTAAEWFR